MTQEYVTVQAFHEEAPRRAPSPGRWRRVLAAALALGALVWATLGIISMWPEPVPEPVVLPTPSTPDAARFTALVYQEWTNRVELVECQQARGFEYEPIIVDQHELLEVTAQYLDVEPATAYPDAPVPMLRHPDLYLGGGGVVTAEDRSGPCSLPSASIDTNDPGAVNEAVEMARADSDFLATVAEQVWAQRHPAQVTHQVSLLRRDHQGTDAGDDQSDAWAEQLAVVTGAVQERTVWVPVVTSEYQEFAQSVGLVESGGAVAVRVSGGDVLLDYYGTYMSSTDVVRCGPVIMTAGVKAPWGAEEDLEEVMQALATGCSALIGAGFAEAETLAEVYWD